jgi:hypothetical protein
MEERTIADGFWLLGEGDAAVADRRVEALDGVEAAIGERFVNEGPKMLRFAWWAPAPTDLAKSARTSSNISLHTALAMFHTVRPLAGSTNPVT